MLGYRGKMPLPHVSWQLEHRAQYDGKKSGSGFQPRIFCPVFSHLLALPQTLIHIFEIGFNMLQSGIFLLTAIHQQTKFAFRYAIGIFLRHRIPPDTKMDCPCQAAICINPLLKMGRLRVFLYPYFDQFLMDLAHKTQCHGVAPLFPESNDF